MIRRLYKKANELFADAKGRVLVRGRTKYFCIGRNKTGTTSLEKAFVDLGYRVGNQAKAELLADQHYFAGNFLPLISYCKSAEVFQDAPFSWPETFKFIDKAFPGSKFILTVRDDAEQWYQSITKFHAKHFGQNGRIPTIADLKGAEYRRLGFMYNTVKVHGTPDDDPYNKEIMISHYHAHNLSVLEYFKGRPEDLLVMNLAEEGAYQRFVDFLGVQSPYSDLPWENKT